MIFEGSRSSWACVCCAPPEASRDSCRTVEVSAPIAVLMHRPHARPVQHAGQGHRVLRAGDLRCHDSPTPAVLPSVVTATAGRSGRCRYRVERLRPVFCRIPGHGTSLLTKQQTVLNLVLGDHHRPPHARPPQSPPNGRARPVRRCRCVPSARTRLTLLPSPQNR